MEKIQRDVSHSHRLVPGPELEEKALVLKQLGETLTELKGESVPGRVARAPATTPSSRSSVLPPSQLTPSCPLSSLPRPAEQDAGGAARGGGGSEVPEGGATAPGRAAQALPWGHRHAGPDPQVILSLT